MTEKTKFAHIQNYLLCVLFQLVLPLTPIAFEFWIKSSVSTPTLLITAAIYSIALGNDSSFKLFFGFSVIISLIFSFCYGVAVGGQSPINSELMAIIVMLLLSLTSAVEKFSLHIYRKAPYWDFN